MMMGRIFAVICAQLEASFAEHAAADCAGCDGLKASVAGGNCANEPGALQQKSSTVKRTSL